MTVLKHDSSDRGLGRGCSIEAGRLKRGALALHGDVGSVVGAPKPGLDVAASAENAAAWLPSTASAVAAKPPLVLLTFAIGKREMTAVSVGREWQRQQ